MGDGAGTVPEHDCGTCAFADMATKPAVRGQTNHMPREIVCVVICNEASFSVLDQIGHGVDPGDDGRHARRHGLQHDIGHAFVIR